MCLFLHFPLPDLPSLAIHFLVIFQGPSFMTLQSLKDLYSQNELTTKLHTPLTSSLFVPHLLVFPPQLDCKFLNIAHQTQQRSRPIYNVMLKSKDVCSQKLALKIPALKLI